MKTIVLARHGKSSWDYPVDDKDRPLQLRGITDAHLVARALKAENLEIGHCFASPANRALHTGMIFLRTLGFNLDRFTVSEALYDFSGESVFNFIKALDDHFQ
ncbi:MAG: histidine phosphatase family protein, partial [Bacteroidota bacterium]